MRRQRFWQEDDGTGYWKIEWMVAGIFAVLLSVVGGAVWFQHEWDEDHPEAREVVRLDGSTVHCVDSRYRSGFGSPNIIDCTLASGETVRFSLAAIREVREAA